MRHRFKFIYKLLIIFAVFVGSVIFFCSGIKETLFSDEVEIVSTKEATLPTITLEVVGNRINLLHGYVANLNEMLVRESITPLTSDRTFTVYINEHESVVKKLKYEIFDLEGNQVETESFTVLDTDEGEKNVQISLKEPLERGCEYVAKITLITNASKRIYYYTRLKLYEDGNLTEKLEFVRNFHDTLLESDGEKAKELERYLEPKSGTDRTSFAYVNINSRLDMVSYGDLDPRQVYEAVPTITEFYDTMASVKLDFVVCIGSELGTEYYSVTEKYRLNYSDVRTYLYNYERDMEEIFNIANFSRAKREFKLGITADIDADSMASPSGAYMAFSYDGDLIFYDVERNKAAYAFTFKSAEPDYERDYYDNHDVRLLNVNDDGTVDFYVYGYMNRGEYEGRVGILLYRYYPETDAREERLYIPINSSYSLLLSDMTDFAYLNERDIFYFSLYNVIYSYDLTTAALDVVASDVPSENLEFCEEEKYLAWQNSSDDTKACRLMILHLETGEINEIGFGDERVRIYGMIDNNVIYGLSRMSDVARKNDGSTMLPSYRLVISDGQGTVLKDYESGEDFIVGVSVSDNMITISRVRQVAGTPMYYEPIEDDTILNRLTEKVNAVEITKRVTDRMLTEYYVSIPGEEEIEKMPWITYAGNIVINTDTTARVNEPETDKPVYYAYSYGSVIEAGPDAGRIIALADEKVGTVISRNGKVVWERGVKSARTEIAGMTVLHADTGYNSVTAAMKILMMASGTEGDSRDFNFLNTSAGRWLQTLMKGDCLDMTGVTLDEALYSVYKKRPVMALKGNGEACVIYAYDASTVTVYEPALGRSIRYSLKEAAEAFEKDGNIFISYSE